MIKKLISATDSIKPKNIEQLIWMVYKTHSGEWLTPTQVHAIAVAIKGTEIPHGTVRRCINNLGKQCKLVRSKTGSAWMAFNG